MDEVRNCIKVYLSNGEILKYNGNYYIYKEDYMKEGCVHFKDGNGKHHRVYNASVVIDEL